MQALLFRRKAFFVSIAGVVLLCMALCSCGDTRHLTYMQGKFDTAKLSQIQISEPVFRKGDLVSIIVYSDNPAATALYNQSLVVSSSGSTGSSGGGGGAGASGGSGSMAGATGGGSPTTPGYLVDDRGNIQFQGLGELRIEGLTKQQLRDLLDARLKEYLKNPYYSIRFMNYRFTVLGEVARPGIFSIPGEHISGLGAMGMAGDLTFYGRRDNVLIMRDSSGVRQWARLDLTKPDVLNSPYFYLQQNDIVYVEASKKKVAASDQVTVRNVSIAATVISTMAILYSLFKK